MRIVLAAAAALAPAGAFAVDYLTAEQAAKLMFPDADGFAEHTLALDAAQLQALETRGIKPRSAQWAVRNAQRGATTLGWVVVDEVIGKFELITYAVGVAVDGTLKPVEILSYRESHGHEIRLPAWRRQFAGKTATAPLKVGEDIANISGATLSCTHVTDGVRRIAAVLAQARAGGRL